jgi:transcriptional regulator with PAS, ATPase and Fis domain
VRELEKTVKRLVVLADDGDTLVSELLPHEMMDGARPEAETATGLSLRSNISQLERKMIAQAL